MTTILPPAAGKPQGNIELAKLEPRYTKYELETLLMCIAPVESWTRDDLRAWKREGVNAAGFRHFTAPNITPIEHYRPKVLQVFAEPGASAQARAMRR
jgi:hypothetical protein